MKNKNLRNILLAAMAVVIAVGATIAYLTSTTEGKDNKFTFVESDGGVTGEIEEEWTPDDGLGVIPGDEIKKVVKLTNTTKIDEAEKATIYGALRVIFQKVDASGNATACTKAEMVLINQIMSVDINDTDWTMISDDADDNGIIYMYNKLIEKDETTNPLFTKVTIAELVDNKLLKDLEAIAPGGVNIRIEGAVVQGYKIDGAQAEVELLKEFGI